MSDMLDKLKTLVDNSPNKVPAGPTLTTTTGGLGAAGGGGWSGYHSGTTTTTGTLGQLSQQWPYYVATQPASPPSLPIKMNIRELVKLLRALEADEELKGIIQKFQPFIGVEV